MKARMLLAVASVVALAAGCGGGSSESASSGQTESTASASSSAAEKSSKAEARASKEAEAKASREAKAQARASKEAEAKASKEAEAKASKEAEEKKQAEVVEGIRNAYGYGTQAAPAWSIPITDMSYSAKTLEVKYQDVLSKDEKVHLARKLYLSARGSNIELSSLIITDATGIDTNVYCSATACSTKLSEVY